MSDIKLLVPCDSPNCDKWAVKGIIDLEKKVRIHGCPEHFQLLAAQYLNVVMFDPRADAGVTRGGSEHLKIEQGSVEGMFKRLPITKFLKLKNLRIRDGFNPYNKMYYVHITDRKTLLSYRIYLTVEEFDSLIYNMQKTRGFTNKAQQNEGT